MSDGEAKQTPKVINWERIPEEIDSETHPIREMVTELIATNTARFAHLANARIGLCWQLNSKPGPDGLINYGKAMILSDFQKEWMLVRGGKTPLCFDVIVVINKEWWSQEATAEGGHRTSDTMRRGCLVHLLLQIQSRIGVDGEQKVDERNRRQYRKAVPNLTVFAEEIKDGAWNAEQKHAYEKVLEFADSLFANIPDDEVMEAEVAGSVGPANDAVETQPAQVAISASAAAAAVAAMPAATAPVAQPVAAAV